MTKIIFRFTIGLLAFALLVLQACKDKNGEDSIGVPTVTFTPTSGPPGTRVSVTGIFYSTTSTVPNVLKFNGKTAWLQSSGSGLLTAKVPSSATTGNVTVTVGQTTGTSTTPFTVTSGVPDPFIASASPASGNGVDGVTVTLSGGNFSTTSANNVVKFNGIVATVTAKSDSSLSVVVPQGAASGPITIQVSGGTIVKSDADFTVPTPGITSFTPKSSAVGSPVVITGTNFSTTAAYNVVKFNGATAVVSSVDVSDAKANKLIVLVPLTATTGKISVTVDGQTGTSADDFTVN